MKARVILFKESGKYYTQEDWEVPENCIVPAHMDLSKDFRRIGNGAVLVVTQEPWGYPHLFPGNSVAEAAQGLRDFLQEKEIEPVEPDPVWTDAQWQYVLTGDRVRIGQEGARQEADVEHSNVLDWNVDTHTYGRPAWKHREVTIKLAHLADALPFPPAFPVQILCNRERAAALLLQTQLDAKIIS